MCIGAAMAKLEMKAMLWSVAAQPIALTRSYLLAHYKFELAEEGQTVTPTAAITVRHGAAPLC